ncbi:hypothetical protein KKF84_01440 [Myxococcota bacterium]|nr:hypothetical protein [Myxococcota bacterium]MBU1533948.1 hypothetical protein [Myxococcota bacterium]
MDQGLEGKQWETRGIRPRVGILVAVFSIFVLAPSQALANQMGWGPPGPGESLLLLTPVITLLVGIIMMLTLLATRWIRVITPKTRRRIALFILWGAILALVTDVLVTLLLGYVVVSFGGSDDGIWVLVILLVLAIPMALLGAVISMSSRVLRTRKPPKKGKEHSRPGDKK